MVSVLRENAVNQSQREGGALLGGVILGGLTEEVTKQIKRTEQPSIHCVTDKTATVMSLLEINTVVGFDVLIRMTLIFLDFKQSLNLKGTSPCFFHFSPLSSNY